jgi:DnaJ-class molecular chaperone
MKNKKLTLIDKSEIMTCWKCEGCGYIPSKDCYGEGLMCYTHDNLMKDKKDFCKEQCPLCNGSGTFRESHYIYVDEVNKIAIDSDCGA